MGMDTYSLVLGGSPNFAIVGEWFLGMIVFFYLVFPILRKWIVCHPLSLYIFTAALYIFFLCMNQEVYEKTLPMLLPRLVIGMCFVKYRCKIKLPAVLISVGIIAVNRFLPAGINMSVQSTYIGIALFCVLVYAASWLGKISWIRSICSVICKYSYAIFICHHVIINYLTAAFDLSAISRFNSWLLFLCCCCVIFIGSFVLQKAHDRIMGLLLPKRGGNQGVGL